MDKIKLRETLFQLSDSEIFHKDNPDAERSLKHPFEIVKTNNAEDIYLFTFDDHNKFNRKRYKHTSPYLDDTQIEIIKHARYSSTPMHIHSYIEMTYVYSGSAVAVINGKKVPLKQEDVCILDPNVPHTILETTEKDILINFLMSKDYFSTAMLFRLSSNSIIYNFLIDSISKAQQNDSYLIFHCQEVQTLKDVIENILCEYYEPNICCKDVIDAYMIVVFSELLRTFQKQNIEEKNASNQSYIGNILQYIEEHQDNCTIQAVANHFSFNPNYLSRYIKQHTGKNFKDLIQELRFNKACILLENTSLPIEEVSHQIGYNNLGFFYQKFNKLYGQSPKEYREKIKNINEKYR